eukprot:scaffold28330_cov35-Attheya_sp.AAC.1
MRKLFSIVLGQCTDVMRQKLEAYSGYSLLSASNDGLGLLKIIKALVFDFQSQKYIFHALHVAIRRAFLLVQGKHMTTQAYMEMFQNVIDVVDHTGGSFGVTDSGNEYAALMLHGVELEYVTDENDLSNVKKSAREMYLATAFFLGADKIRFGRLIEDTENDFLQATNKYPKTLQAAYNLLSNYRQESRRPVGLVPYSNGVSFNTNGDGGDVEGPKEPNKDHATSGFKPVSEVTCFRCGKKGHYANACDEDRQEPKEQTGEQMRSTAPPLLLFTRMVWWIVCHTQECLSRSDRSTVDVFHNKDLLKNIRKHDTYPLRAFSLKKEILSNTT